MEISDLLLFLSPAHFRLSLYYQRDKRILANSSFSGFRNLPETGMSGMEFDLLVPTIADVCKKSSTKGCRAMKCPHCLGFMVIDACLNMEGDRSKSGFRYGVASAAEKSLIHVLWKTSRDKFSLGKCGGSVRRTIALSANREIYI